MMGRLALSGIGLAVMVMSLSLQSCYVYHDRYDRGYHRGYDRDDRRHDSDRGDRDHRDGDRDGHDRDRYDRRDSR